MDYDIQQRPWTFDWSLEQLERAQDYLMARDSLRRIIYILYDDCTDHYIALVDCDELTACYLCLL